jgi:hypothetical protein
MMQLPVATILTNHCLTHQFQHLGEIAILTQVFHSQTSA